MPTAREIEQSLFRLAPKEGAMSWDNVGLLEGDPEAQVQRVLVALDITEEVADEAIRQGAQLIVAHHPLMNCAWLPVQTVRSDTPQGHLLMKLIRAGVAAICMHTNLDVAQGGVNDVLADVLKLVDPGPLPGDAEHLCRCGTLDQPMELPAFAARVCRALHSNGVRFSGARPVFRVAVGGGACGDFIDQVLAAGCDTFVTSDLTYHQFLDAPGKGINLIDAGHFPTEDPICNTLVSYLTEQFPQLSVSKSASHREAIQYFVEGE